MNDATLPIHTFVEYQAFVRTTAIYPEAVGLFYCALGLNGEAGEVAEKVKKIIRDNAGKLDEPRKIAIALELGDVLWYLANMAHEIGMPLSEVARLNVRKLQVRQEQQKLQGEGDNR